MIREKTLQDKVQHLKNFLINKECECIDVYAFIRILKHYNICDSDVPTVLDLLGVDQEFKDNTIINVLTEMDMYETHHNLTPQFVSRRIKRPYTPKGDSERFRNLLKYESETTNDAYTGMNGVSLSYQLKKYKEEDDKNNISYL